MLHLLGHIVARELVASREKICSAVFILIFLGKDHSALAVVLKLFFFAGHTIEAADEKKSVFKIIVILFNGVIEIINAALIVAVEQDMAKALGQAIALCRTPEDGILCIDRVRLKNGDYLDVGNPIGPALPVVVKTLILER